MKNTKNDHKGKIATYLRVSSVDQNLARQDDLREGADRVFEEKASGGTMDRPVLQEMLAWVREGDLVRVHSMDRLARSFLDLDAIVTQLKAKGCAIEFVKENMLFDPLMESSAIQTFMFQMLASAAEFERAMIRARQAEGIAKAKARGVYKGRQTVITQEVIAKVAEMVELGIPKTEIGRRLSISRSTVYKALTGEVTKTEAGTK